jgi:hypothetical protein
MAKTIKKDTPEIVEESITEVVYNGRQASELFSLHPAYKSWVKKQNLLLVEKTKSDWENFFKESKII